MTILMPVLVFIAVVTGTFFANVVTEWWANKWIEKFEADFMEQVKADTKRFDDIMAARKAARNPPFDQPRVD